jgi:hypothetical protein
MIKVYVCATHLGKCGVQQRRSGLEIRLGKIAEFDWRVRAGENRRQVGSHPSMIASSVSRFRELRNWMTELAPSNRES